jgi:hypothetical protein
VVVGPEHLLATHDTFYKWGRPELGSSWNLVLRYIGRACVVSGRAPFCFLSFCYHPPGLPLTTPFSAPFTPPPPPPLPPLPLPHLRHGALRISDEICAVDWRFYSFIFVPMGQSGGRLFFSSGSRSQEHEGRNALNPPMQPGSTPATKASFPAFYLLWR